MDFYVGWSHSDAIFPDYFPGCPTLISAVPDNRRTLRRFKTLPLKLIVDSGSFTYVKHHTRPSARDVFNIQLDIIERASDSMFVSLVHYDEPMFNKRAVSDKYYALQKSLYNAYEFMHLFSTQQFPQNIVPMAVIQGFDKTSVVYAAKELQKSGYTLFGIGSLLGKTPKEQLEFVKTAASVVGPDNLHVFGVTGIPQIRAMSNLGIRSFDSSRPTIAAFYFQIFYSNPFRTFIISNSRISKSGPRITDPLPCDCPVCETDPNSIVTMSPRKYAKLRSIHNYYHFSKAVEEITAE